MDGVDGDRSQKHSDVSEGLPFAEWLRQHLASERAAVVEQLQMQLTQQLNQHHRDLIRDVKSAVLASREVQSKATDATTFGRREVALRPDTRFSTHDSRFSSPDALRNDSRFSTSTDLKSSWHSSLVRGDENHRQSSDSSEDKSTVVEEKIAVAVAEEKSIVGESSEHTQSEVAKSKNWASGLSQDFLTAFGGQSFLLREGERTRISCFVRSWFFEALVSVAILANCAVMGAEVQYVGTRIGHDLGHQSYTATPSSDRGIFDFLFVTFTCIFLFEFILRCLDLRVRVFCTGWMWFDAFILSVSVADILSRFIPPLALDMNPSAMRVARLCRMLRLMKIAKSKEGFAALFLLIKSIQASTHALLWSCLLLVFVMLIAGLIINQMLLGYLLDQSKPMTERLEVFELFGTYSRMFITMFEFTLGNWAPPQRVLMENVTEWWGVFVVTYRSVLCFALVNISAAVFNSETSRAAAADDEVALLNKERTAKRYLRKLEALFKRLDQTNDGAISVDEFENLVRDPVMMKCLSTLQVDVEDVQELFHLLGHGDGLVFHDEFVRAMMSMRGEAKSIDLIILMKMARNMDAKLDNLMSNRE